MTKRCVSARPQFDPRPYLVTVRISVLSLSRTQHCGPTEAASDWWLDLLWESVPTIRGVKHHHLLTFKFTTLAPSGYIIKISPTLPFSLLRLPINISRVTRPKSKMESNISKPAGSTGHTSAVLDNVQRTNGRLDVSQHSRPDESPTSSDPTNTQASARWDRVDICINDGHDPKKSMTWRAASRLGPPITVEKLQHLVTKVKGYEHITNVTFAAGRHDGPQIPMLDAEHFEDRRDRIWLPDRHYTNLYLLVHYDIASENDHGMWTNIRLSSKLISGQLLRPASYLVSIEPSPT